MKNKRIEKTFALDASNQNPIIQTDPLGSYTGRPSNPNERPIQDADDL